HFLRFYRYLASVHCPDYAEFYLEVLVFKGLSEEERVIQATRIMDTYLAPGSPMRLPIPEEDVESLRSADTADAGLFDWVVNEVLQWMLPRFHEFIQDEDLFFYME